MGDSAPGIAMEYKVHVDAGKKDCYWQYVHPGATLYVSYQVLKGGDGAIGMAVRDPKMKVVHPYAWKASSEYEDSAAMGGYYSVCLDNQFSRFSAKLVNLYITTFRYDEWEKFSQDLQDNAGYVQTWSIVQLAVIILCTVVQVYFVKSFFKDPRDGKSSSGVKMRT